MSQALAAAGQALAAAGQALAAAGQALAVGRAPAIDALNARHARARAPAWPPGFASGFAR